jgi:hypothetical protein
MKNKLSTYFQRFLIALLVGVLIIGALGSEKDAFAAAAGSFINLGKSCCKGKLPYANGGFMADGSTITVNASGVASASGGASSVAITNVTGLGSGVASAVQNAANAASGPVVLNSSSQYPAKDGSLITGIAASQVGGVLEISGTVATNDTFVAASSTSITPIHHATAPTYTANHTFTATDLNTLSPISAASSGAITLTLGNTLTMVEGDRICVEQAGVGKVTFAASGVATPDSASGYLSICAQSGVACLVKKASGTVLVGCRGS